MKRIKLTRGKYAFVDNKDFIRLNKFKWCAHFDGWNWYAKRRKTGPRTQNLTILMHQSILSCSKKQEIDHKNHNGLDNRRSNLRLATHQQNVQNRIYTPQTGIQKIGKKYRTRISVCGKKIHLGMFTTKAAATIAYKKAAKKYFGDFKKID